MRNVLFLLQPTQSETTISLTWGFGASPISEKSGSIKNKECDWPNVTGVTVLIFGCVEITIFFILNVLASIA